MPTNVLPKSDYRGPVLRGQRWQNRGIAGHGFDLVAVLRVNSRSVQVVYEGQRSGGSAHKSGQHFGIPLERFRQNFNLYSQAPGVRPEDLMLIEPAAVVDVETAEVPVPSLVPFSPDPVERLFEKRKWADDVMARMEGKDVRHDTKIPIYAPANATAGPPNPLDVLLIAEVEVRTLNDAEEEPPMPTAPPAAPEPTPVVATFDLFDPPAAEPDPLDAFLDNGRKVIADFETQITSIQAQRDAQWKLVESMDTALASLRSRRARMESAVNAAIAAALEEEEPGAEPVPPTPVAIVRPVQPAEPLVVKSSNGGVRLHDGRGYMPQPGKISQREWVLNRFAETGTLSIQAVVTDFSAYFNMRRDQAIKNVSSLMGFQMKKPDPRWPVPVRTSVGVYGTRGA